MKKVLLTAMALLTIASTSVFGYYGANSDWINFLVDANQFRARLRQIGFVLGNDTIRGVVGVRAENGSWGSILADSMVKPYNDHAKNFLNFTPTVSAGIGYTSEAFSIGVGYNYNYKHNVLSANSGSGQAFTKNGYGLSIHTPVLTMTALNNNFRIAIPVQVAVKNGDITSTEVGEATDKSKYLGISLDPQIRYYTGIDAFNEIRLYVKYGMNEFTGQDGSKASLSSLGFDLRAYFGATVGDVRLKPFLKVVYNTSLDAKGKATVDGNPAGITAGSAIYSANPATGDDHLYKSNPWDLEVLPVLGMEANSDIVSIYVEAALGYKTWNRGRYDDNSQHHGLRWNAYGEVYVRPIKDLEWYFEAEIGNPTSDADIYKGEGNSIQFANSTGITWYLPTF